MSESKHIHFIGICGVATSAEAIAFKNAGYVVTGSDKGFYPPVSTALEKAGISFYAGWHPEKMIEQGKPDMVVAISYANDQNPEIEYAKANNIEIVSDGVARGKYFAKENSIVCVGTWGKTTSSALLAHVLTSAGLKPSYMTGGLLQDGSPSAALSEAPPAGGWSVLEGDEYKTSVSDTRPKFIHCKPTHILLTAVSWDHADLYPSEDHYFAVFEKLVSEIPENGLLVACIDEPGVRKVVGHSKTRLVTYGKRSSADYRYVKVGESKEGLRFGIMKGKESFAVESGLLGGFQAENIVGCFAMAYEIGIPAKNILAAIASFGGIKRRLEKRLENEHLTVIDDIAHSPEKARSVLRDLRQIYKKAKIVAVFEPNIGSRTPEAAVKYTDAFSGADTVIIPKLTKLKIDQTGNLKPLEGQDLTDLIGRSHTDARYIPDDDKLVEQVVNLVTRSPSGGVEQKEDNVIVFLGSHGFRGMIEQVVDKLSPPA